MHCLPFSFVCVIDKASIGDSALDSLAPQHVFAIPVDRKLPKIRIRTRQISSLLSQKFLVAIDAWDAVSRHPAGHFVRALGQVDSKEAEIESLLLEYDVPYRPFPKAILDCLPEEGDKWQVPPLAADSAVWRGRQDLRDLIVCSIDPIGCQDIDDALHARRLPNGRIEAGVRMCRGLSLAQADACLQTLPMFLISCNPTTRWMRKPARVVLRCTSSTKE
jgi:exosome complex exonuclease DIS3/RRP44